LPIVVVVIHANPYYLLVVPRAYITCVLCAAH
jgi:hypothetical protein